MTNTNQMEVQNYYMDKVKEYVKKESERLGRPLLFYIQTFGCQMNAHDSEKILGILKKMGYEEADEEKNADFIIYNTCCVRENAENKVYGNLGYLNHQKKLNPHMKIALCGCMMQQDIVIQTINLL